MQTFKIVLVASIIILLGAGALGRFSPQTVHAQTANTVFTTAIVGEGNGIAIVNQDSGSVTYCTSFVNVSLNNAVPNDSCKTVGGLTPGTGLSSLSIGVASTSFFVVNTQSGGILQCPSILTISSGPTPSGSPTGGCINLGMASK
jgi:hypothetical protein